MTIIIGKLRSYVKYIIAIISEKISDNDKGWFKKFTERRQKIEQLLIEHKGIITLLLSAMASKKRTQGAEAVLNLVFEKAIDGDSTLTPSDIADVTGLESRLYTIESKPGVDFSEDAKSSAFLKQAFAQALLCPICKGYLDPAKSASYDHIERKEDGGNGHPDNCQVTHPYCNSSIKN